MAWKWTSTSPLIDVYKRQEHIPAAAAKKAANQYRKTRSQLMKLAAEPGEGAQAQALDAVTAYTLSLIHILAEIEQAAGQKCQPIGHIGYYYPAEVWISEYGKLYAK